MTTYHFDGPPAIDEHGEIVRDGVGQVYALDDTDRTTPLPVTDLAGVALTELATNRLGLLPPFAVEGHKVVVFKSGDYEALLVSITGFLDDVEAARAAAQDAAEDALQSRTAAEQAAQNTGEVRDQGVTDLVTDDATALHAALVSLIESVVPDIPGGSSKGYVVLHDPGDPVPPGTPDETLVVILQS